MGLKVDYIFNGQGFGSVADRLIDANMDPGVLRPWRSAKNGKSYVTLNVRGRPKNFVTNTPATLTYDAWKDIDRRLIRVARPLLRVWGDLVGAGLSYSVPDGMGTTVLQQQTMTDWGFASVSMDGVRESDRDRPVFDTRYFPMPIIHGSFQFTARQMAAARRGAVPLDIGGMDQITRKVVEKVESFCIGTATTFSYGGGSIYGLTTMPERVTKTMTLPTAAGWTPAVLVDEINDMIQDLQDMNFNGPYGMYFSPSWAKYMNGDYADTYGGETLRSRLDKIEDLSFIRKLHYGLTGYQVVIFQLDENFIRAVQGMKLTTLQWDSHGGMVKNFKILCIMLPQLRTNADEEIPLVHGTAA